MIPQPAFADRRSTTAGLHEMEVQQFSIDTGTITPMYLQLAMQLQQMIEQKQFDAAKPLPSVYRFNQTLGIARATAFRAYKHLNKNGVVQWKKGQGFYVHKNFC